MAISRRNNRHRSRSAGFTLIELMVTVLIVAILAAIAIPGYTNQMRKSRRTEAKTALLELAAREERYFATNSAYTNVVGNLGYSGAWPVTVGGGFYQINVTAASATAFTATATPINGQASDSICGTYTLDNTGTQTVSGTGGATTCWN